MTLNYSLFVAWLAELHVYSHRIENARREATRALDLTRKYKEEGNQAWALRLLGEVHVRAAETATEAERYYREALSLAESRHMRPLIAHCHLGLGRLYRRSDRISEGKVELSRAVDMYSDMDMQFYLKQAEAELQAIH